MNEAVDWALAMTPEEQKQAMSKMYQTVTTYDVTGPIASSSNSKT